MTPKPHKFRSNEEAYDRSQTDDDIKDGDILVTPKAVAILVKAWPVLVHGDGEKVLHHLEDVSWESFDRGRYLNSYKLAKKTKLHESRIAFKSFLNEAEAKYGVKNGQIYVSASDLGRGVAKKHRVKVVDVEKYKFCDDVVIKDLTTGEERRIDAFKLAKVRYSLEESTTEFKLQVFDKSKKKWDDLSDELVSSDDALEFLNSDVADDPEDYRAMSPQTGKVITPKKKKVSEPAGILSRHMPPEVHKRNADFFKKYLGEENHQALGPKLDQMVKSALVEFQKLLKAKGFSHTSRRESALVHHIFAKGDREITISGWHGTGRGNRNYGPWKTLLHLYDSASKGYKPVVDVDVTETFNDYKGGLRDSDLKDQQAAIDKMRDHLEDL